MFIQILTIPECSDRRPDWNAMFTGYVNFYKREMTDQIAEQVWSWLNDPSHELEGMMAFVDGTPAGIAHFRRMVRPMAGAEIGYLDDLFVLPAMRGKKVGVHLLNRIAELARERNWAIVRWLTADNNYQARAMYDRLAAKTTFNLYEMAAAKSI